MNKEQTLALWRQGRDAWNAWAKAMLVRRAEMERDGTWASHRNIFGAEEPDNEATIAWMQEAVADFQDKVFEEHADFSSFHFAGPARFYEATFQQDARFDSATFSRNARFDSATFSRNAGFVSATFSGDARFDSATFSGDAGFVSATFSGYAGFDSATFSGDAAFDSATFSRNAGFVSATFSGYAGFDSATFSGYARFHSATFSGDAGFVSATFSRNAAFQQAQFKGYSSFAAATFERLADFSAVQGERAFTLEGAWFNEVPDFIQAHFAEAPRLDNSHIRSGFIEPRRFWGRFFPRVKSDVNRSARYRALKRLAIDGHDHVREQEYFAGELRSLRGCPDRLLPNPLNWFRRDDAGKRRRAWPGGTRYWFGLGYQLLSDFGRSMLRPLGWWGLSVLGFALAYLARHFARAAELGMDYGNRVGAWLGASVGDWLVGSVPSLAAVLPPLPAASATACLAGDETPWSAALGLSIRKALPFAGIASSEKLNQIYACLYGIHGESARLAVLPDRFTPVIPDAVDYLGMVQLVFSILLLFLFLLAVRSHFRIR